MITTLAIREVSVFRDRAEVVRRGELELDAGTQEVVIGDLPAALADESVRASARGSVPLRLLSTDVRTVVLEETHNTEVLTLRERLEGLDAESLARSRHRDGLALRRTFLEALSAAGGRSVARAAAGGAADMTAGTAISGFLGEQAAALDREAARLDAEDRGAERERAAVEARLAALTEAGATRRRQVAVAVEMAEAGRLELEVRYQVGASRWSPLYDLRLTTAEGRSDLQLSYQAEVTQRSGEDWSGVDLILSTARAGHVTQVPELTPWLLQPYQSVSRTPMGSGGVPLAVPRAVTVPREPRLFAAALAAPEAAPGPPPMEVAESVSAAVESGGPTVTFRISGSSRIPSDGSPHKVPVGEFPLEHRLDFITAPCLAPEVVRRASVTNSSPAPLLPGRAQLFVDAQMVGATELPLVAPRDQIELSLGTEDRVKVKREMVSGGAEKKLLQDRRVVSQGFRIEVTNLTGARQRVVVRDQLPISHDERIRVRDPRLSPPPSRQDEMGRVEWALDLDDSARTEIQIGYTVEHPRDLRILNLPG